MTLSGITEVLEIEDGINLGTFLYNIDQVYETQFKNGLKMYRFVHDNKSFHSEYNLFTKLNDLKNSTTNRIDLYVLSRLDSAPEEIANERLKYNANFIELCKNIALETKTNEELIEEQKKMQETANYIKRLYDKYNCMSRPL